MPIFRIRGYAPLHLFWLGICKLLTLIFFPRWRLIRYPIFLRIRGQLQGGDGLTTGWMNRIDVFQGGKLVFGKRVQINDFCHIACVDQILIGDDCLIASRVFITDHDHEIGPLGYPPNSTRLTCQPVTVGNRVWIGEAVSILKGSTIGDDVVIGANSVVTKDIPAGAIVAGCPAKIIRMRS